MLELPTDVVIATRPWRRAVKTAPTKIRPLTQEDVAQRGPVFLDREQRPQRVEVGRYLCVGIENEEWTCSVSSMQQRVPISDVDSAGFRLYVQREQKPVLVTLVEEPFCLIGPRSRWHSEAGAITWNGQTGPALDMRVVALDIFRATYQFLDDEP